MNKPVHKMVDSLTQRIFLSPPHMSGEELAHVQQAFADNWIAPAGPHLAEFEQRFCDYLGTKYAVALSSGTAAIHLALLECGVTSGDDVLVSTLTFAGSVNPILYLGARPVFIDCDAQSWNLDPQLLEDTLREKVYSGKRPKALVPVHLYGQSADMAPIMEICDRYGVTVIEDAAEALGTTYCNRRPGTFGKAGAFSFNGNKIITTSGGGMLVSDDKQLIDRVRKLSSQAREPFPHYEHVEVGFNYRMSNILAAIGIGQLSVIEDRVHRKREIYAFYKGNVGDLPGITFVEEMDYGRHTRWLTVILVDAAKFGANREQIRLRLEKHNIESRPLWKPMHLQPVFKDYEVIGGAVSEQLFKQGLCLPSGTALTEEQLAYVVSTIREMY